ncbi:MAG: hypothetical protein V3V08_25495 [Nannocystaceae bacterium]
MTPDCHERITIEAFLGRLDVLSLDGVELPDPGPWEDVSEWVADRYHLRGFDATTRYVAMSLFLGVREPDSGGASSLNVKDLRANHGSTDSQHPHCTRNTIDDYAEGDRAVLRGCAAAMATAVARGLRFSRQPAARQHIEVPFTLDFYGRIDLSVWAPAYHLGRGLHSLQDAFSHSIRSDDLHVVLHVMNYTDAIGPERRYDEGRDGLRHSVAMDYCDDETQKIVDAARRASGELIAAAGHAWEGGGTTGVDGVVDHWLGYTEGCSAPEYCDSPWVDVARSDPTFPLLGCACVTSPGSTAAIGVGARRSLSLLSLLLLIVVRRRRGGPKVATIG